MKKYRKTMGRLSLLLLLSTLGHSVLASQLCEGVSHMPSKMTLTRAKDQAGIQSELDPDEMIGLVDVHTYNHYYTFQVDRDVNERNEGVVMDLITDTEHASTTEGFAFRLRAEFNSAEASRAGMGFRVILGAKNYDKSGYTIDTIAEMSSLNTEEGEGTVAIDIPSLPAGRAYQLRYEFGQKEVLRNGDSLSMEEDSIATGDSVVHCNLPFFAQELVLIDRKVLKNRVRKYNQTPDPDERDVRKHEICNFNLLDGEAEHGELGLQCNEHVFNFPIGGNDMIHDVDEQGFVLRQIASYPFRVSGTEGEPITQLFKMTVGTEFSVGAGFRAVLHRTEGGVLSEYDQLHPFSCLLDQSCQFAWRQQKNHQSFQVVLTTGDYVLQLFDLSQEDYTNWLLEDLQLSQVPFTVYIESYPILQNEIRDHCPFMFLLDDFIQTKFIDGAVGQKFHFNDKIIMNLYDLKQEIMIQPELNSNLKVVIREAFGVNAMINLCKIDDYGEPDCFMNGSQIGTTEILYAENIEQDQHYTIVIDYSHSILAFHKFDVCPHIPIEVSMISVSEAEMLMNNRYEEALGITDKQTRSNLKDIFNKMSNMNQVTIDEPDNGSSFMMTSRSDREFEVLYSHDFEVALKMGLFIEIFYSPYDDEVMELYIGERYELLSAGHKIQADNEDEYDNEDLNNKRVFALNKYKASKVVWVDLEPGMYTIQILNFRQPSKATTSYYEKVYFQLYVRYDFVNVPREVFLPGHLNYHGLLGVGDETHDFGHITLFWDDMTLWHKNIETEFQVQSEMASVSVQIEQPTDLVKVHLLAYETASGQWTRVGYNYHDMTEYQRIDTIEEPALVANQLYKIQVFKDAFSEHAAYENVEMGERYGTEFSIKIDFSEFDDSNISDNLQKEFNEFLPTGLDQVAKEKKSLLGMNEKSFSMGNRDIIHLIEYGDGFKDHVIIPSYVPKERRVFVCKQTDDNIVVSLPFEVEEVAEIFYAGIYEYTQGANLMSLAIVEEETHEEIALSSQGKYFSLLSGIYLPQGTYYLVVKNDRVSGIGSARQAPLEFVMDVVRHQIPEHEEFITRQLEAMQLCQLPQFPDAGLSKPGYIHPLSGQSTQTILRIGVMELDSGSATYFTLIEDSFMTVYVEAAEDIPIAVQVSETGGVRKSHALSTDQDAGQSNFLKQEGFVGRNVAQLRLFLKAGSYWINTKAINEDVLLNFDQRQTFCDTFTMVVTVNPIKEATKQMSVVAEEEGCEEVDPLVNQLTTDGMVQGKLVREISRYGAEVGYFDFDNNDMEGPFMVYFQLDYDISQEGVMAVVLSQYDKDYGSFSEIGLYQISDSATAVFQIVDRGTYAISIQSIVSSPRKFGQIGFTQREAKSTAGFSSYCFRGVYTYMVASVNEHDGQLGGSFFDSFYDKANRVRVMETLDDIRNMNEFRTCNHQQIPQTFPISDEGFERQYTFLMSNAGMQVIDLIVEEPSLVRVLINMRNQKNKVTAHLQEPGDITSEGIPLAESNSQGSLIAHIEPDQHPYILKLIHTEFQMDDPCPVYDLHIAVKPLHYIVDENLQCMGYELPPEQIVITKKTEKIDVPCGVSSSLIEQNMDNLGRFRYDMILEMPHSDYFLDVEMRSDFLTGNMRMLASAYDEQTKKWGLVAQSHWFDENSHEDILADADVNMGTKIGDKTMIQKLRFLEDASPSLLESASKLHIKIAFYVKDILEVLKQYRMFNQDREDICFNFEISLFADEVGQDHLSDNENNKLIRIDWHGNKQSNDKYDTTGRLTAFLEFEKSMAKHFPRLKTSFQETIYLQPLLPNGQVDKTLQHVIPVHFKPKAGQDDVMVLGFAPHSLDKGVCYKLTFASSQSYGELSLASTVVPDLADSLDFTVCTSVCECDPIGTAECREGKGTAFKCKCHPHFIGHDCSECEDGYFRNVDGFCEQDTVCADLGGSVDCNGHGTCYQEGPTAFCECDPGFTHNGLDQCGRCSDPLMTYPYDCGKGRNWVVEQEDFECEQLQQTMPRQLYKSQDKNQKRGGLNANDQVVYQELNGMCDWMGRYALVSSAPNMKKQIFYQKDNTADVDRKFRKQSQHGFFVAQTSMFRIYVNTLESNVKVRWTIVDSEQEKKAGSDKFEDTVLGFGMLQTHGKPADAIKKPYNLMLEYEHEQHHTDFGGEPECPKIEIHFIVEPAKIHTESLECSDFEIEQSKEQFFEKKIKLDRDNYMQETSLILPSTWITDADRHTQESIFDNQNAKLAMINIDLNVQKPGIFSIITAMDFSETNVYINLKNKNNKQMIAMEKNFMLDDVEMNDEHLADSSDFGLVRNHQTQDFLSVLEMPHLDVGQYTVQLAIPKGSWFAQKTIVTCLKLDFMMEFISKDGDFGNEENAFLDDSSGQVDIVSIYPLSRNDLQLGETLNVMLTFNRQIDWREVGSKLSDLTSICYLQNLKDKTQIKPTRHQYDKHQAKLFFSFEKEGDRVNQIYQDNNEKADAACYALKCKDRSNGEDDIYFKLGTDPQKYCFGDLGSDNSVKEHDKNRCNPEARAKYNPKTKSCICPPPYMGRLCHQCESGFYEEKRESRYGEVTVCVPDEDSDFYECNGFGQYNKRSGTCDCDRGYAGAFCEMCDDMSFEYPDCTGLMEADLMDSMAYEGYNEQRREQVYHEDYHVDEHAYSPFQQQCQYTDFPNFLNQIQNHKQFISGEFHIADVFTINHDEDNVIEFTPRNKGFFKIMIKQPEREIAVASDESMHLEIGMVKADGSNSMKTTSNHLLNFKRNNKEDNHVIVDFSVLEFQIDDELVNEPLLIYFRGMNQTHDEDLYEPQLCAQVFIEIEFRATQNLHACQQEYPYLQSKKDPIVLTKDMTWPDPEQISLLQIADNSEDDPFFYNQDFYIQNDESMAEFDIEIQLAQKFIDQHLIVPVVEILEMDIDLDDYDSRQHKAGSSPQCKIQCLVAGHKLYNAFTILTTLPHGTMIRIWLVQNPALNPVKLLGKKQAETCVNYSLSVRTVSQMSQEHEEALKDNLYCEHTRYLPRSLNRLRYLGDPADSTYTGQQDFNYIEYFRVDNLKYEGRSTTFTLSERTVVRIDGVEHEQLMYFLKILKGNNVVAGQDESLLEGTEAVLIPSIFTVLEPGDYTFKIEFVAREAEILKQSCQSIQLQIAMNRADEDYLYPRTMSQSTQVSKINLDTITSFKENYFEAKIQPMTDDEGGKWQILYDEVFVFEERDDLNLLVKVNSDFLRADVNFMMIGLETGHHFMPQHKFEDSKKMLIMDLPFDIYRFVVFMQNVEMARNTIFQPVLYSVSMSIVSSEQRGNTFIQPVTQFDEEDLTFGETIGLQMPFKTPEQMECLVSGRRLPTELTENILLHETDFAFTFAVPGESLAFINKHIIKYKPEQGEDLIRIQIDQDIKIKIFEWDKNAKSYDDDATAIAISHDRMGNNIQELVAEDLSPKQTYAIVIVYANDADDLDYKSSIECLEGTMQVKIANSQSEYRCLDKKLDAWETKLSNQQKSINLSYKNLSDKGKHVFMVASSGRRQGGSKLRLKPTPIELVIKDEDTDLEVTIEGTDHFYGSTIVVESVDEIDDGSNSSTDSDRGLGKTMKKIFGNRQAIQPVSITSPKHMTKLRFFGLQPGKYQVRLSQPRKPPSCENAVDVLFQVSQSLDSKLVEKFSSGNSWQERFQSKQEINEHGVFKLPTVLPLQVDSYRFLGGAGKESRYLLISDEYTLNDDESKNIFNFGKIPKDSDYYVRVYVEDSTTSFKLECLDENNKSVMSKDTNEQFLETSNLPQEATCTLQIYHREKKDFATHLYLDEKIRLTLMVTKTEFVQQKYRDFHKEGLASCPTNQWPLALAKTTEINTNSDEQSYYNYPLIRYPLKGAYGNPVSMNSYYFRFNETQRFYFEVGSNFVVNHAVLKLSPTQKAFGSYDLVGKQLGNINVIDTDVPPGDYKLEIFVYKNSDIDCGMFSLRGLLNMHSAMSEHLPGMQVLRAGSSMCEILNSESAPSQIFEKASKTRKGNEDVIDRDGNYFKHWPNLLIVRQHNEVLEPWTHEILLDLPPGTSFVQFIMSLEQADRMLVKIYSKQEAQRVFPILKTNSDTNEFRSESKFIFKLEGGKAYEILIEYSGDMYNAFGEEEPCTYFDLTLAINSIAHLANQLSCDSSQEVKDAQSLLTAIPKEIEPKNLDFRVDGFYTIRYPEDFKELRQQKNGKNSILMVLPSFLDIQDPFSVSSSIAFDVHMADFNIELVAVNQDDVEDETEDIQGLPNYQVVEYSSALMNLEHNDDQTFIRQLDRVDINPRGDEIEEDSKLRYMLAVSEKQSWMIFDEVAKQQASSSLCLPLIFKLDVSKAQDRPVSMLDDYIMHDRPSSDTADAFGQPTIIDMKFIMNQHDHSEGNVVPFNVQRVSANVLVSQPPFLDMFVSEQAFLLAFKVDGRVTSRFRPADLEVNERELRDKTFYTIELHYNVDLGRVRKMIMGASRLELVLEVDPSEMYNEGKRKTFEITKKLQDKMIKGSNIILVEFPEDMEVKFEAEKKRVGNQIRDTLGMSMREITQLKKQNKLPPDLFKKIKAIQNSDFENMDESEISEAVQTIETIQALAEGQIDFDEVDSEDDEFVEPKCLCVHGECNQGSSECSKCYSGWTGRLCDIAENLKSSQRGMNPGLMDEEEIEEEIFKPKKIRDSDQTYKAPKGRRQGNKSDKSDTYKPRQSYNGGKQGSLAMSDGYDLDGDYVQPKNSGTNHKFSASDADSDSDGYSSGGSSYTSKSDIYGAKESQGQYTGSGQESQGFFAWIFWSFIWLVQWIVYIAIIIVCLLLAKAGCESFQTKLRAAQQKKKKGKRKRQNEEDGMGFIGEPGANNSGDEDNDDSDGSDSPIEMTLVNRKGGASGGKNSKARGGRTKGKMRKDSDSSEPSEKELKLFDQDDEDRQPQSKKKKGASASKGQASAATGGKNAAAAYNPFDTETGPGKIRKQDSHTGLMEQADVVGQAMVNEIDEALGGSSDEGNDEFGSFV